MKETGHGLELYNGSGSAGPGGRHPGQSPYWLSAPDPYVDAVAPANEVPVTDPANLVGPGTRVTTVTNPSTRPYRFLRLRTGVQTARFDSMRAEAVAS